MDLIGHDPTLHNEKKYMTTMVDPTSKENNMKKDHDSISIRTGVFYSTHHMVRVNKRLLLTRFNYDSEDITKIP